MAKAQKSVPFKRVKNSDLLKDIDKLARRMRIKYLMRDKKSETLHPFWEKSEDFVPPLANNAIEDFILALKVECSELDMTFSPHNLSKGEKLAISELNNFQDLV